MLNINNIIWKDLIGFEGRYQVSNSGLIRSILSNHGKYQEVLKSLSVRSKSCQYLYVAMSIKDKNYHEAVHRAVAKAFIPNLDNKPMVNHVDGNKLNNNVCNLEWVTCSENHSHAYATGLKKATMHQLGIKNGSTSKYNNVTYDPSRNKWKGCMKHKGKMLPQKRFDTEYEAALYVNTLIDEYKLNRPKNIIN